MNILIISPNSPEKSTGGIERYLLNLIAFNQRFSKNHLYILLPNASNNFLKNSPNVTIIRSHLLSLPKFDVFGDAKINRALAEKQSQLLFILLNTLFHKYAIDLIETEAFEFLPVTYNLYLHLFAIQHQIPVCNRVHSFPYRELHTDILREMPWAKIIPVSNAVSSNLLSKDIDINKIYTVYPGVNRAEFNRKNSKTWLKKLLKLTPTTKIILHASRIANSKQALLQDKGIINLVESFSKIAAKYPDYYLLIATATPPMTLINEYNESLNQLNSYISLFKLENRVIVKKFNLQKMPKVYSGSDIFVMASVHETFGQVYTEAMATGLPVIGTNVGGITEIIVDNENGILVTPGDSSQLSSKIEHIIRNPEITKSLTKKASKSVNQRFASKIQFSNLYNLYQKLLRHYQLQNISKLLNQSKFLVT